MKNTADFGAMEDEELLSRWMMLASGVNIVLVQSDDGVDDEWWRWLFVLDGRDEMKGMHGREGT